MKRSIKFLIPSLAGSFFLMLAFQNCGKVQLQAPSTLALDNSKSGTGFLCLPDGYTLDTFFVTNLNIKTTASGVELDSDGDGLSDREELQLGTNPYSRRTSGKILDSICSSVDYGVTCGSFTQSCSLSQNAFGLNECDILALNLNQNAQVGAGIDSDKDGIPDYLEIRINSFPNLSDAYNDLDFDLLNTLGEAERGTSVRNSNAGLSESSYAKVSKSKISSSSCTGEYWKVDIQGLPTLPSSAFTDNSVGLADFSYGPNENVVMYFLKIKPVSNPSGYSKVFSGTQKIQYDPNNVNTSLLFNQNLLYFTGDVEQ